MLQSPLSSSRSREWARACLPKPEGRRKVGDDKSVIDITGSARLPDRKCRDLGRVDPPGLQAQRIFGRDGRPRELVPIGDAIAAQMPAGDDIKTPKQDSVEGTGPLNQTFPVGRSDQEIDK